MKIKKNNLREPAVYFKKTAPMVYDTPVELKARFEYTDNLFKSSYGFVDQKITEIFTSIDIEDDGYIVYGSIDDLGGETDPRKLSGAYTATRVINTPSTNAVWKEVYGECVENVLYHEFTISSITTNYTVGGGASKVTTDYSVTGSYPRPYDFRKLNKDFTADIKKTDLQVVINAYTDTPDLTKEGSNFILIGGSKYKIAEAIPSFDGLVIDSYELRIRR